jgi:hypothetical protein
MPGFLGRLLSFNIVTIYGAAFVNHSVNTQLHKNPGMSSVKRMHYYFYHTSLFYHTLQACGAGGVSPLRSLPAKVMFGYYNHVLCCFKMDYYISHVNFSGASFIHFFNEHIDGAENKRFSE